jgi:formylglycine-generating enzyme required for sulfatase activity
MTADVLRRAFEPFFTTKDSGKGELCLARAYNFANVAAWTEDCYVEDYRHTPPDGNPNTSGPCTPRVVRGGSWDDDLQVDRAARRYYYAPGDRLDNLGFRLARVVPP